MEIALINQLKDLINSAINLVILVIFLILLVYLIVVSFKKQNKKLPTRANSSGAIRIALINIENFNSKKK